MRIGIALPLIFAAVFSAFGQSLQPGQLPQHNASRPHDSRGRVEPRLRSRLWRKIIDAHHAELAANYAAEGFIQHNPNVPTWRAALVTFFKTLGPAIDPIPDQLQNPPMVEGTKGNFVWLVFEHKFKYSKDPSQLVYENSDKLVMVEAGNGASEQLLVEIESLIAPLENYDMLQG